MPFAFASSLILVKKTKTTREKKSRGGGGRVEEERIDRRRCRRFHRRKKSGNIFFALFLFCVLIAPLEFARLHPTTLAFENAMSTTTKSPYHGVSSDASKYTSLLFENVPGFTRSKLKPDYAMIAHESRVYGGLFGWQNTLGAYVVSPGMNKATILMTMVSMSANGKSHLPSPGAWRFAFVLDGACSIRYKDEDANAYVTKEGLRAGEYFYFPMNVEHEIYTDAKNQCELVMYEAFTKPKLNGKPDEFPTGQKVIVGETDSLPNIETPGEIFRLKKLLPQTLEYDVNFHVMDFAPGETLNVKELHHPQHGLVILEGQGIYRLNDDFMPVQQGDVIYMSPWVTQWYGALGKNRTRYLISKDTFRDPLRDSNP